MRFPVSRRGAHALTLACLLCLLLPSALTTGCGSKATDDSEPSEARLYAQGVQVQLDVTTVDDMMVQMPTDMTPQMSRTPADYREWVWVFGDGSSMLFSFRAVGGEGSGQGLVLDHIQLND